MTEDYLDFDSLSVEDAKKFLERYMGEPYTRDNKDGTFTHTFAPGEDGILNAEFLDDKE